MTLNVRVLKVFGPALIAAGLLGLVLPPSWSLMSGAAAYDVFHVAFGALATFLAYSGSEDGCVRFNVALGAIDLYQLAAHFRGWFPLEWFRWTRADDVLHLVIGLALLTLGLVE